MTDIAMPRLSDSMEEGTILTWLKADGDMVAEGEELVEIETDKATMTYESPASGTITVVAAAGMSLPVGAVIARIGTPSSSENGQAPAGLVEDAQPTIAQETPVGAPAVPADGSVRATPVARRLARAHGIDLSALKGSGTRGRVTRSDVAASAGIELASPAATAPAARPAPTASTPVSRDMDAARGEVTVVKLSKLQQVVARRMAEAKATVPEFQVETQVAMDAALALRAQLKAVGGEVVPSVNDLMIKAAALALRQWPRANGSYKDGRFELYSRINVGVAVAAQDALVVPTVTDADTRSLGSIASEVRRLAERVRNGTITPPELSGATFTVSNLGMYGMTAITPVINTPQAAILGVGVSRPAYVPIDGQPVERQIMTLTLTCDHRILYGADAAQFLAAIRSFLEQPLGLAL